MHEAEGMKETQSMLQPSPRADVIVTIPSAAAPERPRRRHSSDHLGLYQLEYLKACVETGLREHEQIVERLRRRYWPYSDRRSHQLLRQLVDRGVLVATTDRDRTRLRLGPVWLDIVRRYPALAPT